MFLLIFSCFIIWASEGTLPDALNIDCSAGQPFKQEDPIFCQRYFECIDKKPILYFCSLGTFFDVEEAACVSEKLVDCGSRDPKMYECNDKMPKVQPNDDYCGSYFICGDDPKESPAFVYCPGHQYFDIDSSKCIDKHLVECDGRREAVWYAYAMINDPILEEWNMFNWVYIWMSVLGIGGTIALVFLVCWMVKQTKNFNGYEKLGIDVIEMQETSATAYSNFDKEEEDLVIVE